MKGAVWQSKGVFATANLVANLVEQNEPKAREQMLEEPLIPEAAATDLVAVATEKIKAAARNSELEKAPRLARLLWIWKRLGGQKEAQEWVRSFVGQDMGLLTILEAFTGIAPVSSEYNRVQREVFQADFRGLAEFLDLETFKERAAFMLQNKSLTERQRFAINQLLNWQKPPATS